MDAHTVIEEWEVSPFDGGYEGLRERQSRRFSGAIEAGNSWLFFADGEPVAVLEGLDADPRPGDIGSFEDAAGQQHEAASPAAARLAAMLALDGEVRGEYFTDETPLSKVHETLSAGGFTGYVELSENVLSGDYYVVYADGEASYLGVLGSSGRLIRGDEAQSKAEGEVGIYGVVSVSMPAVEIPQPSPAPSNESVAPGSGSADAGPATDATTGATPTGSDPGGGGQGPDSSSDTAPETPVDPTVARESRPEADPTTGEDDPAESAGASTDGAAEPEARQPDTSSQETARRTERHTGDAGSADRSGRPERTPEDRPGSERDDTGEDRRAADSTTPGASEASVDGVTTRAVPSLDPERSQLDAGTSTEATTTERDGRRQESRRTDETGSSTGGERSTQKPTENRDESRRADDERIDELREEYERRIQKLKSELESVRGERDRLQRRVSNLEADEQPATGGRSLSAAEALAGTSLFVREGTRGGATLEDAYEGGTDRETLAENLRIEYHTQFDDEGATVDGEAFDDWLRDSTAYRFAEWLVTDLLFEIQSAKSVSEMRPLYDAIPEIDRIGFADTITVGDGKEGREVEFDVVLRNQMGDPLFVADISQGREPTHADGLKPVVRDATGICEETPTLAAAFAVTESFFEPDALELTREATSSSLLSRGKHPSFVKISRKNGYHLCLVEAPEGAFHLSVPEL
jgi:hypothetical protein